MRLGGVTPNVTFGPQSEQYDSTIFRSFVFTTSLSPERASFSPGVVTQVIRVRIEQPFVDVADPDPEVRLWAVVERLLDALAGDDTIGIRVEGGGLEVSLDETYTDGRRVTEVNVPVLHDRRS